MFVLAVDTSTPAVTAGLAIAFHRGELIPAGAVPDRRVLDPEDVDAALREQVELVFADTRARSEWTLSSIGAVVCGVGPGLGDRALIGKAVAADLAEQAGKPLVTVSSLDAIAYYAILADYSGKTRDGFATILDAGGGEVHWLIMSGENKPLESGVGTPAVLRARLDELGIGAVAGHGADLYSEVFGRPEIRPDLSRYPESGGLVMCASGELERFKYRPGRP